MGFISEFMDPLDAPMLTLTTRHALVRHMNRSKKECGAYSLLSP